MLLILCLGEVDFAIWTALDVKYFRFHTFHSTGFVTFNVIFKREVSSRFDIFNDVQERQSM